jgi:hypothetical protein
MKCFRNMLTAVGIAFAIGAAAPVFASQDYPKAPAPTPNLSGLHAFDFYFGNWRAHHRKLADRLVGSHDWIEFDGTINVRPLMNGWANVDESIFVIPNGGTYHGVTLRSYDGVTGLWNIWWLDGREPSAPLDPAVKGASSTASVCSTPTTRYAANPSKCVSPGRISPQPPRAGSRRSPATVERPGRRTG